MDAIINGVRLHYEVYGRGGAVLFIHGYPLSGDIWQACIEPMQDDYRLIIPDLRGHGGSDASERTSMGQLAHDLHDLLDEVGERGQVVLVAQSMGGYVAFEFFRRYPERVAGLVLVSTRAGADSEEARQTRYQNAERVQREGSQIVADVMSKNLFAPDAPQELVSGWRERIATTPPEGIIAALHAMAERPSSLATLEDINVPTLIIAGEEDTIIPLPEAEAMQQGILGSGIEVIPGAAHMAPVEQPVRFVALLEQFLDSLGDPDVNGNWSANLV